ncbi:MAG TPA: histone deacetylase family protein [Methylotenera sp.]|nr:histone deacetylase family protein [Methylotenera sp.]HPH06065.1 histone deacetylase family protein [Methylotenera sp.]HPN00928.1 histone deacetylase family protein [Methylotenera sp.]
MRTAYISHPEFLKHDMGPDHPECPARMYAISDQLIASGILDYLNHYEASKVGKEILALAHNVDYIDWVYQNAPSDGLIDLDGDTLMNPYTLDAALYATGAVVNAVDLVMSGEVNNAFCNIRPPGHHAKRNGASGFCIFNNVAVAAAYALEYHGLQRVAIADFDVHHCDGTEDIFRDDPRVMLCSTFQHPFYPFCGAESSNDHIINVPLAAGTNGEGFRSAVEAHWLPALARFEPQLILISAGFDAHREDDMGGLALNEKDYLWVTQQLKKIAAQFCHKRIVSALEGGYELHALGRSVMTHVKCLAEL